MKIADNAIESLRWKREHARSFKCKLIGGRFQMNHPNVTWLDGQQSAEAQQRLHPIYPLTDGLNQRQVGEIVAHAVAEYAPLVQEAFPDTLREKFSVCEIETAIRQIHAPKSDGPKGWAGCRD